MFKLPRIEQQDNGLVASTLHDHKTFYTVLLHDLRKAKHEVIIESPFITARRMTALLPVLHGLTKRGVRLVINTKPLEEQEPGYYLQAKQGIAKLQEIGARVLFTGGHHRKLAIIDRRVLYEGSLNILSQNDSCEIMRRMDSKTLASQMLAFLDLEKFIS